MFNNDLEDVRKKVRITVRMYMIKSISLDEVEVRLDGILGSSAKVYGADPAVVINPDVVATLIDEVRLTADPELVAAAERAVEGHYWIVEVWFTVYRTVRGTFELVWQEGGITVDQTAEQIALYNRLLRDGIDGYYDWHALRYLLGGAEFGYFVDDLELTDEVLANWQMDRTSVASWRASDRNYRQAINMVVNVRAQHREASGGAEAEQRPPTTDSPSASG